MAPPAGPEAELPLDVAYTKLLDWLVERKLLKGTWQDGLKAVRGQLEAALAEVPEGVADSVGGLIKGKRQQLHYYHCRRVMELLEGAQEGRVRNFFGSYTTPLLRAWAAVLKAYERDNVFLGEAARTLVQHGVYALPGLRRSIAQLEKQIQDGSRKIVECEKTAQELERRFRQACQELEIPLPSPAPRGNDDGNDQGGRSGSGPGPYDGIDFQAALRARTAVLPALFEEVEALARADGVGEALAYYGDVRRFLLDAAGGGGDGDEVAAAAAATEADDDAFPVLRRVRAGERGASGDGGEGAAGGGEDEAVLEIDWEAAMAGDETALPAAAGDPSGGGEIDWGGEQEPAPEPELVAVVGEERAAEIDWAIEVEETGAGGGDGDVDGGGGGDAMASSSAVSSSSSLVADAALRSELANDLLELEAFLQRRRVELAGSDAEGGLALVGQFVGPHAALQHQSLGAVAKHLEAVRAVLAKLRAPRLQSLLLVQASPAYLDRVAAGLRQKLEHMAKMGRARDEAERRREEAIAELGKAVPELEAMASATRALKAQVEASLQKLLKGRRVHIMGDINTL